MDSLYDINEYDDDRNRRSSLWISIGFHLLLLLLFLVPLFNQLPTDNEEFKGVLVVFGNDVEGGSSSPDIAEEEQEPDTPAESSEEWEKEEIVKEELVEETLTESLEKEEIVTPTKKEVEEAPEVFSKVVVDEAEIESAKEEAKKAKQHKEAKEQQQKELEAKKKEEELEKESKKQAAAVKARKEKEEQEIKEKEQREKEQKEAAEKARKQKELEEKKKQFGDLFNNGSGDTNNDGSKGDPIGDPDGAALEGVSTGKAEIGGGLSDRGVAYEPAITDDSQKAGKVVIRVCVDKKGNVIESKYTQRGSNTTDRTLVEIAEKAASKYTFTAGNIDKQCGTITIDFKLR